MAKIRRVAVLVASVVLGVIALLSCSIAREEPVDQLLSAILVPTYAQQAYVKASNTGADDQFGAVAVSADGNTLVVGAPGEDSSGTQGNNTMADSGAVYVFVRSGGAWSQQAYLKASNRETLDNFGSAVALSDDGNTLAIGAIGEDSSATNVNGDATNNSASGSGAVYIFKRNGAVWSQHSYVKASNTGANDWFGHRVELSGDGTALAVGAYQEDSAADGVGGNGADNSASGAGAAYVYVWSGSAWSFQAYIKAPNSESNDRFGVRLALSTNGSTLAVGADFEDSNATGVGGIQSDNSASAAGAVYVYLRTGVTWSFQAYLKAPNTGAGDLFGASVDLAGNGNTLIVGASSEDSNALLVNGNSSNDNASNAGAAYVYTRDVNGSWSLHSYVKAPNTQTGDWFGFSTAISRDGQTISIGAWSESSGGTGVNGLLNDNSAGSSGAVYSYRLVSGGWTLTNYVKASNTDALDHFCHEIALSSDGRTMAVGTIFEDSTDTGINGSGTSNAASGSGAVYVFASTDVPTYQQQAYVKAFNTNAGDGMTDIALSGDGSTLAVGSPYEDSGATGINGSHLDNSASASGAVYVYSRSTGVWAQQAYVKASNTDPGDWFGWAVALSADGNTLAVGAPMESSGAVGSGGNQDDDSMARAGAVYIFTRSGTTWAQQAYVKASNTETNDRFGAALALSANGDTLAVGAYGEASDADGIDANQYDNSEVNSGAVYVFTRSSGTWAQQSYVKASNSELDDNFGVSVALAGNGDTLAVGAPYESSQATLIDGDDDNNLAASSGAAYVFRRSMGVWTQQAYVKASNTESGDLFGQDVALSGDGMTLAVVAAGEDSNAMNVNGASNNLAAGSGAAYVYTRGVSWAHQAYLKASNTEALDFFGMSSVALSDDGNALAIGALYEDGGTTGVNGDRGDNSASNSGAVFTFTRSGTSWSRGDYVKASNTGAEDLFGACALSSDGTTLAVAAAMEDSNATSINGSQNNNSATDAGAAYVFVR